MTLLGKMQPVKEAGNIPSGRVRELETELSRDRRKLLRELFHNARGGLRRLRHRNPDHLVEEDAVRWGWRSDKQDPILRFGY